MATGGDKNLEFKIGMKKKSIKKDINIKLPSAFNRKMAVIKKIIPMNIFILQPLWKVKVFQRIAIV